MSEQVKSKLAFDVCWEVYRGVREVLESKRDKENWQAKAKFLWDPNLRPRLNEFVADFALAGHAGLDGTDWTSRMVMFRLYYLGLAPYENARHFLGLSEKSWASWENQIRERVGAQCIERGLFPPRRYFAGRRAAEKGRR